MCHGNCLRAYHLGCRGRIIYLEYVYSGEQLMKDVLKSMLANTAISYSEMY
jgi:hypothetical protein